MEDIFVLAVDLSSGGSNTLSAYVTSIGAYGGNN